MILNTVTPTVVKTIARAALATLGAELDEYIAYPKYCAAVREDMDRIFNRFVRILH